jgi:hypothetical protein
VKIYTALFCLFLSINALAQTKDSVKVDSAKRTVLAGNPLIIVDGKIYKGDISSISPKDIVNVSVLKEATTIDPSTGHLPNGEIIVVTKIYATAAYQKKFSDISKSYKRYLEQKQTDTNLQYVLNNTMMNQDRKSTIEEFYQLSPANIKNITFKKDSHFTTDATVIITTKDTN